MVVIIGRGHRPPEQLPEIIKQSRQIQPAWRVSGLSSIMNFSPQKSQWSWSLLSRGGMFAGSMMSHDSMLVSPLRSGLVMRPIGAVNA